MPVPPIVKAPGRFISFIFNVGCGTVSGVKRAVTNISSASPSLLTEQITPNPVVRSVSNGINKFIHTPGSSIWIEGAEYLKQHGAWVNKYLFGGNSNFSLEKLTTGFSKISGGGKAVLILGGVGLAVTTIAGIFTLFGGVHEGDEIDNGCGIGDKAHNSLFWYTRAGAGAALSGASATTLMAPMLAPFTIPIIAGSALVLGTCHLIRETLYSYNWFTAPENCWIAPVRWALQALTGNYHFGV